MKTFVVALTRVACPRPPTLVTEMEGFNSHLNMEQMNKVQGAVREAVP